jgi:hypothetical protein
MNGINEEELAVILGQVFTRHLIPFEIRLAIWKLLHEPMKGINEEELDVILARVFARHLIPFEIRLAIWKLVDVGKCLRCNQATFSTKTRVCMDAISTDILHALAAPLLISASLSTVKWSFLIVLMLERWRVSSRCGQKKHLEAYHYLPERIVLSTLLINIARLLDSARRKSSRFAVLECTENEPDNNYFDVLSSSSSFHLEWEGRVCISEFE